MMRSAAVRHLTAGTLIAAKVSKRLACLIGAQTKLLEKASASNLWLLAHLSLSTTFRVIRKVILNSKQETRYRYLGCAKTIGGLARIKGRRGFSLLTT